LARSLSPAHEQLAAADPKLARLIERIDHERIEARLEERTRNRFEALVRIVVGQQVSTAAARTIWNRLLDAFDGPPEPERLTDDDVTGILRVAGLSGRKASYVIGIAEAVVAGELRPQELVELGDEEVIETLVALRGLGRWSAEMFLIFDLGRPDVFSGGDLGLRRGIQIAYGMAEPPSPEEAVEIAERWSPNRTLASLYLWEAAGIGLPVEVPED
jgi:DNA-3-methyladenine glycosylase II